MTQWHSILLSVLLRVLFALVGIGHEGEAEDQRRGVRCRAGLASEWSCRRRACRTAAILPAHRPMAATLCRGGVASLGARRPGSRPLLRVMEGGLPGNSVAWSLADLEVSTRFEKAAAFPTMLRENLGIPHHLIFTQPRN